MNYIEHKMTKSMQGSENVNSSSLKYLKNLQKNSGDVIRAITYGEII